MFRIHILKCPFSVMVKAEPYLHLIQRGKPPRGWSYPYAAACLYHSVSDH